MPTQTSRFAAPLPPVAASPSAPRRPRRGSGRSPGQALAEFALVVPIFMLLLGAVVQFGMVFWSQNTLNQIVRDAGRYAATEPDCTTASQNDVVTKTTALAAQSSLADTFGPVTVTMPAPGSATCPPTSNASVVWVSIQAHAQVPVFFPLVGGGIDSQATFRMEPVSQ